MNYQKHYDLLIERSKTRILEGYVEKHHIIPRCLGGSNEKDNIAILTPEEHFLAHQLLVKIYPGNRKLIYAAQLMTVHNSHQRNNNKLFGWLRRQMALSMSIQTKKWLEVNEHPKGFLGHKHPLESIEKITAGLKRHAQEKSIEIFTYHIDGSFDKKYNSIMDCARDLQTTPSNVKYTADGKFGCCKGRQIRYQYYENIDAYIRTNGLRGKIKSKESIEKQKNSLKEYFKRKNTINKDINK